MTLKSPAPNQRPRSCAQRVGHRLPTGRETMNWVAGPTASRTQQREQERAAHGAQATRLVFARPSEAAEDAADERAERAAAR